MSAKIPKYAEDQSYKILCEYAYKMGLEIVYRDSDLFPDYVLALQILTTFMIVHAN